MLERVVNGCRAAASHPWAPGVLGLVSLAALSSRISAPLDIQSTYSTPDDSFYYYQWARNLASGIGPTADGILPTNGVQPAWALLLTGLALFVSSAEAFSTGALIIGAVLLAVGQVFASRLVVGISGSRAGWFTSGGFVIVIDRHTWALHTGMEIGLNIALIAIFAWVVWRANNTIGAGLTRWKSFLFGALAGTLLLGRVDHVVILLGLAALELVVRWRLHIGLFTFVKWRDLPWIVFGGTAIFAPYLLWNRIVFDAWLPVSGRIKLINAQDYLERIGVEGIGPTIGYGSATGLEGLARTFAWTTGEWMRALVLHPLDGVSTLGVWTLTGVVALVLWQHRHSRAWITLLIVMLVALMARQFLYAIRLSPELREYAVWYLAPEWILAISLSAIGLDGLIQRLRFHWRWTQSIPTVLALLIIFNVVHSRWPGRWTTPDSDRPEAWHRAMVRVQALRWAEENLPPEAQLGAFNSGILHFYAKDLTIANLDGRVDDGTFANLKELGLGSEAYVKSRGVTHLLDTWIDDGFWRGTVARGKILYEAPCGPTGEGRIVVVELPEER